IRRDPFAPREAPFRPRRIASARPCRQTDWPRAPGDPADGGDRLAAGAGPGATAGTWVRSNFPDKKQEGDTEMKLSSLCAAVAALALSAGAVLAQEKPAELKIGITTFLSGPASVFGVPGKAAAELLIEQLNAEGGIGGVKVVPTFIDEGIGGDKMLSEY